METEIGEADNVKIYTLLEDYAGYGTSLYAQHGVSFLLEIRAKSARRRVLFDVGQSAEPILHNMEIMGIDPKAIDMIFLSHCHYDHTGGLVEMLKAIGKKGIPIVAHPKIFRVNLTIFPYLGDAGLEGNTKERTEGYGGRWILVKNPMKLMEGVMTTGEISREERVDFEKEATSFYSIENGELAEDFMLDDVSLAIRTPSGLVVISGCSHAGIASIIKKSMEISGSEKVKAAIGGFHLINAEKKKMEKVIKSFEDLGVEKIYTGHCTGLKAEYRFLNAFGENFEKLHCGKVMEF